ncbi:MAG: DUF5615 family PIN-like protein [Thaumarchaeota archaeon]|nr:DUF5615 family PIN-like protein [Nitrososphaerota archaeon]MDE0265885.1 DUF5615 family PIN-like protein [Nitrososphaerota archaeon]MDE0526344.1 DUF5615 family PIN-like protein [Nitrososphaerota archaeon]
MKVLVDEHSDGLDERLLKRGFEAQSVKKLISRGMALRSDFSVLKYAESNKMVLVTKDKENILGCQENNILYVALDDDALFEHAVSELERLSK